MCVCVCKFLAPEQTFPIILRVRGAAAVDSMVANFIFCPGGRPGDGLHTSWQELSWSLIHTQRVRDMRDGGGEQLILLTFA